MSGPMIDASELSRQSPPLSARARRRSIPPAPSTRTAFVRCTSFALLCSLVAAPLAAQVPAAEYAARRDSLAATMADGVLIALGGHEPAEDYVNFFPAPSFFYLTGIREPDAVLVM